jgi:hypothetical protein
MSYFQHRNPIEAHQVQSGAKKDMEQLPFQGEADYRAGRWERGVQMFEDDGMNGNYVNVNKSDWIVKDVYGDFTVYNDKFFQETFREVTKLGRDLHDET